MTEHKNLAAALAAFQGDAPKIHKGETANAGSYSYKYADLADIVENIKGKLAEHGLSFSSFPCVLPDGKPGLRYVLRHSSGDVESDTMSLMLSRGDAQAHGSAISYARRYALCAVLNIVADADDDGVAATQAQRSQRSSPPAQSGPRVASEKQRNLIRARASESGTSPLDLANAILIASGKSGRDFESLDAAEVWVSKALERLPAGLVNPVLESIAALSEGPVPA